MINCTSAKGQGTHQMKSNTKTNSIKYDNNFSEFLTILISKIDL